MRPQPRRLPLPARQPQRSQKRHAPLAGRVRAKECPCPQPCDDCRLTPALVCRKADPRVVLADPLLGLVRSSIGRSSRMSSPRPVAARHLFEWSSIFRASGFTGGCPANVGGISISALVMSTATGFRSLAWASSPSRCASSGIDPPPQNGSSTGGGLPPVDFRISVARPFQHLLVVRVLPLDQLLDDPEQPLPLSLLRLLGRELGRDGSTGRPRATRTAPPGTPPAAAAPTTGAAWTGAHAGWTSPGPPPC